MRWSLVDIVWSACGDPRRGADRAAQSRRLQGRAAGSDPGRHHRDRGFLEAPWRPPRTPRPSPEDKPAPKKTEDDQEDASLRPKAADEVKKAAKEAARPSRRRAQGRAARRKSRSRRTEAARSRSAEGPDQGHGRPRQPRSPKKEEAEEEGDQEGRGQAEGRSRRSREEEEAERSSTPTRSRPSSTRTTTTRRRRRSRPTRRARPRRARSIFRVRTIGIVGDDRRCAGRSGSKCWNVPPGAREAKIIGQGAFPAQSRRQRCRRSAGARTAAPIRFRSHGAVGGLGGDGMPALRLPAAGPLRSVEGQSHSISIPT